MHAAFRRALAGAPAAIVIGCDCPALHARSTCAPPPRRLRAAHDAVIAPAEDGGYVLIGLGARGADRSSTAIAWGGPTVLERDPRAPRRARLAVARARNPVGRRSSGGRRAAAARDRRRAVRRRAVKRLVLVGGGHAHVEVLRRFGRAPLPGVEPVLVSPHRLTPYSGMLPGLVAGHYEHAAVHIDLERAARFAGARFAANARCRDRYAPARRDARRRRVARVRSRLARRRLDAGDRRAFRARPSTRSA